MIEDSRQNRLGNISYLKDLVDWRQISPVTNFPDAEAVVAPVEYIAAYSVRNIWNQ